MLSQNPRLTSVYLFSPPHASVISLRYNGEQRKRVGKQPSCNQKYVSGYVSRSTFRVNLFTDIQKGSLSARKHQVPGHVGPVLRKKTLPSIRTVDLHQRVVVASRTRCSSLVADVA
jgi:hypothetical protein